jgi:hypothetical protein
VIVTEILETLDLDGTGDVADRGMAVRVEANLKRHKVFVVNAVGEPIGIDQEFGLGIGDRTEAQK